MLVMQAIHKDFSGVTVLDGVDFQVEEGEVHALLGANGAGKSTLIKVLGGQYPDARGTTTINGRMVDLSSPKRALLSGIGVVHQEFDLVPEMTVAENIFLGLESFDLGTPHSLWRKVDRNALEASAHRILDAYHLGINPSSKVGVLSAGAQQITEIARVLALQSDVMIFDEPTARLGQRDRDRLFEVFEALRHAGKKIVFVTHYLDEVMAIADRASVMRDGRMIARRAVSETSVQELSRLMVGEDVRRAEKRPKGRATGPTVLDVRDLSDGTNFKEVGLTVAAGEVVGLVGHLGSGRQEVTRCILGARPSTGRIAVTPATVGPAKARSGRTPVVGFVPENRRSEGIFAQLSVSANVAIGLLKGRSLFAPLPRREIERTALDAVRKLQIKTAGIGQKIGQLSGGNQQKVVFGRSMASNPALYVIEAPTVGVDVKAAVELHSEIFALAARGAGVLLATDDLDEALLLCDRILVMLRGRITDEMDPEHLTRQDLVTAMGAT